MRKIKKLLSAAALAMLIGVSAVAVGCSGGNDANSGDHTHEYSSGWAFDTASHWHPATCGHDAKTDKAEHSYNSSVTPPTTTSGGYTTYTCVCGYSYIGNETPMLPTTDSEWTYDGDEHWQAILSESGTVERKPHEYKPVETVAPTCSEAGYDLHECKICGYWYKTDLTPATGEHEYDETQWLYDTGAHWHPSTCCDNGFSGREEHEFKSFSVAPTCDARGYTEYSCIDCGYSYRGNFVDAKHIYAKDWTSDEYTHWHAATCDHADAGKDGEAQHVLVYDGGSGKGVCEVCGKSVEPRLEYALNEDGETYSVTGLGCIGTDAITVPAEYNGKSVTAIAKAAFKGSAITSVTLPASIGYIGTDAFRKCTGLTSITIPASVTDIGANAFRESGLTSVTVPANVVNVGENAFYDCAGLVSAEIHAKNIGKFAFSYTGTPRTLQEPVKQRPDIAKLASITLGSEVRVIDSSAFQYCPISSVTLPEGVQKIGMYAFAQTDLTSVTIPASVTQIGEYAFYDCKLTSVVFTTKTGWKVGATSITEAQLTASGAATLLTDTYLTWTWKRG